jgi:hypothetical protein
LALVAFKKVNVIMTSAAVGAIVGVPAILTLAFYFGPVGGASGGLIAESLVLAIQSLGVAKYHPRNGRESQ